MFDFLVVKISRPGSVTTSSSYQGLNLKVPTTRAYAGDKACSVAAPRFWKNLPLHNRNAPPVASFNASSVASFKLLLKTLFACTHN